MKSNVSLSNFTEFHGKTRGVEIHSYMPLPSYVPTDEISVDLGQIATIAKGARFESVKFGLFEENPDLSFSIGSTNQSGMAAASAAITKTASLSTYEVNGNISEDFGVFPKARGNIKINTKHPDLDNKKLREPQPWAALIDKGIRDGLGRAGKEQLLNPQLERIFCSTANKSMQGFVGLVLAAFFQEPIIFPAYLGGASIEDAIDLKRVIRQRKKKGEDYERSCMRYYPVDRFFAIKALCATKKIVKVA